MPTPTFRYVHSEEMGEISGFGGIYEEACQRMLDAGVHWIIAHPTADVKVKMARNIIGLVDYITPEAKELEKILVEAAGEAGATGAMMQTITARIHYVHMFGWDQYCKFLIEEKDKPEPEPEPSDRLDVNELVSMLQEVFGAEAVYVMLDDPEEKPN